MKTTYAQKDRIREIIRNLIADNRNWLRDNFILVGDKGDFWILNYLQGPRNEYNCLVRGMVVRKPIIPDGMTAHGETSSEKVEEILWLSCTRDELDLIVSFPFIRFFNHGESEAAHVDFSNADMVEKLDGTMVGVFFTNVDGKFERHFHTRKMCSVDERDMVKKITSFYGKDFVFMPTIKSYVDKVQFEEFYQYKDYTFVFEFLHEASYVLTKYNPEQYGLYLLAARNNSTHEEMSEQELNEVSYLLGVGRPKLFDSLNNLDQIQEQFDSVEVEDFEGFVFRDRLTGHRVKVKDPEYVRKHHILDETSYKRILPRILEGEEDEVLAYFPHLLPRVEEVKKYYNTYLDKCVAKVLEWKSKNLSGRELAVALFGEQQVPKWERKLKKMHGQESRVQPGEPDKFFRQMILSFQQFDESEIKNKVDFSMKEIALNGNPKTLLEMIGLTEEEQEVNKGEV